MKKAYIGIGSNLGDPVENCLEGIHRVGMLRETDIVRVSNLYRTEPLEVEPGNWFINGVIALSTGLSSGDLLEKLLAIENEMGRVRNGGDHWESRIIDLDILLFGMDVINSERLSIPHPLMHKRRFVLVPMVDLAPDLEHPLIGKNMRELLRKIPEHGQEVRSLEDI